MKRNPPKFDGIGVEAELNENHRTFDPNKQRDPKHRAMMMSEIERKGTEREKRIGRCSMAIRERVENIIGEELKNHGIMEDRGMDMPAWVDVITNVSSGVMFNAVDRIRQQIPTSDKRRKTYIKWLGQAYNSSSDLVRREVKKWS